MKNGVNDTHNALAVLVPSSLPSGFWAGNRSPFLRLHAKVCISRFTHSKCLSDLSDRVWQPTHSPLDWTGMATNSIRHAFALNGIHQIVLSPRRPPQKQLLHKWVQFFRNWIQLMSNDVVNNLTKIAIKSLAYDLSECFQSGDGGDGGDGSGDGTKNIHSRK